MKKQDFLFVLLMAGTILVALKSGQIKTVTQQPSMKPANTYTTWFAQVTEAIATSEYGFIEAGNQNYTSVNRRNGFRIEVTPTGFALEKRETADWRILSKVKGIFAGGTQLLPEKLQITSENNTILTYHFGDYAIEYMNSQEGLRQNFIIQNNPSHSGQLRVDIEMAPGMQKELTQQNTLLVKDEASGKYTYGDIHAYDAQGLELPANMTLHGDVLAIHVDAENAAYPVLIDPLSTTPNWAVEGNQAAANMAFAVSAAGDVNSDGYDDVVVGAAAYDAGQMDEGKAFLYLGSATGLSTTPVWQDEGDNEGGLMGKSVAAAGDVNGDGYDDLLIGLGLYSGGESEEGRAHLYYGNATGVSTNPDWIYEANQANAGLGFPLEGLGDVNNDGYADIIIGANGYDNGEEDEGRAYAFYGSSTGLPASPSWTVESNSTGAVLGHAVSAAGDVNNDGYDDAIVGGWGYNGGSVPNSGKAWVYMGGPTGLSTTAAWEMEGPQSDDYYAFWVSGVGDVNKDNYDDIMVGAKRWDGSFPDEGKAWLYYGSATGPSTTSGWEQEGDNDEAEYAIQFGPAGDVNGDGIDDVIMGSHFHTNTQNKEGKALLYLGSYSGLNTTAAWSFYGGIAQANLGWTCDGAGDVNNDGFDDVIVGAFKYSNPETYEGSAFVFHGFNNCTAPVGYTYSGLTSTGVTVSWGAVPAASNYKITIKSSASTLLYYATGTTYNITGLTPSKKYKSWIQAHCGAAWSLRSNTISFMTPPMRITNDALPEVYPNPSSDIVYFNTAHFRNLTTHIKLSDTKGNVVKEYLYEAEDDADKVAIDIADLANGMYFYTLKTPYKTYGGMVVKK
jgi:hypothetical protein